MGSSPCVKGVAEDPRCLAVNEKRPGKKTVFTQPRFAEFTRCPQMQWRYVSE